MKRYFWTYILIMALAIFVLLFWRRPKQSSAIPASAQKVVQQTNPLTANMPVINQSMSNTHQPASQVNPNPSVTDSIKVAEVTLKFVEERNKPIDFYCRFIDQDSNPIPDVKVKFGIEKLVALDPAEMEITAKYSNPERTTDANGRIEIHGEIGDNIGIGTVSKDGYLLSPKAPRGFGGSSGSYENPVIFKMWKEGAKEPLIGGSHVFGIDSGKIYTLNLITGKKIEGEAEGDLRVMITRPSGVGPHDKFLWSFSIEAIQGGFAEPDHNDEFMYITPESGYEPKIEMQFDPNDLNWIPNNNETNTAQRWQFWTIVCLLK